MERMRCTSWLCGALLALAWSSVGGLRAHAQPARAAEPGPREASAKPWIEGVPGRVQRRARDLFLAGNDHMDEQQYPEAAEKYREALALWQHPAFYYNLAVAQINIDRPIAAYRNLVKARSHGPEPLGAEKYKEAGNYVTLLRNQLAELTVVCEAPGAVVSVDGERLFVGPGEHTDLARPGGHQLVVELPDGIPYTRSLTLAPGESLRHVVRPDVLVPTRRWATWKPWAVTAIGAVMLAGAGYVNARAFGQMGDLTLDIEVQCRTGECSDLSLFSDRMADINVRQRLSFAGMALGGTVLVTSALLLYVNRERLLRQPESRAAVTLSPVVAEDGAIGVHALGRF